MTFTINGIDFSRYLYRYGLAIQYEKIYGKGGGFTISGEEIVDLKRIRAVVTASCNPLTSEQLSKLSNMCRDEYVMVMYSDPVSGEDVQCEMIPDLSAVTKSLIIDGVTHWEGAAISLRER